MRIRLDPILDSKRQSNKSLVALGVNAARGYEKGYGLTIVESVSLPSWPPGLHSSIGEPEPSADHPPLPVD